MKRIRRAADAEGRTLRVGSRVLMPKADDPWGPGVVAATVSLLEEDEDGAVVVIASDDRGREMSADASGVEAVTLDEPAEPYFDRFDVCEAFYLLGTRFHSGQWSRGYAILSKLARMRFQPRQNLRHVSDLTENGEAIYRKYAADARAAW